MPRAALHAGEAAALADGTPVTREDEGRSWVVALAGERELEPEAISAALGALREQPGLRFISYGLHCGGSSRMCLRLSGNLCELRVDEAVAAVRAGIAADPAIAGAQIELSVQLAGNLEPRCAADDPACLPVPYEGGTYDRLGSRLGGVFASHSAGECDYDGQCMRMGCGNHCLSWEYGGANEGATCEGYSFPRPIFCGCVDSECQWFSQR